MSSQVTGLGVSNEGEFGANEWLVDELYEQFKIDKNSVDKAWWPVLEAYHPVDTTAAPAAPPAPEQAPAQARRAAAAPAAPRRGGAPPGHRADPGHRRTARRPHHRQARSPQPIPAQAPKAAALDRRGLAAKKTRSPSCAGMPKTLAANMDESLTRPHRDERAHDPGEAHDRQPHRDQQPHVAHARRQGQLHAPHRLGDHPGAQGVPEPERLLRRDRRQAVGRRARRTSTSASRSTCPSPTARARCWCRASSAPTRSRSASSSPRTRTSSRARAPTS